jgi:hypothetical protein
VDTTYATGFAYDVTAGVGKFNGSYVGSYLDMLKNIIPEYPHTIIPSTVLTTTSTIIADSMRVSSVGPVNCADCNSYLLSGGLLMTTPWAPTSYYDFDLVNLDNVTATQIQFESTNGTSTFDDGDCKVYGAESFLIGIKVCVKTSDSLKGSFEAGMFE